MLFLGCILISWHCISFDSNWFDEESPYGKYAIHATFPDGISNFGSTEVQFSLYDKNEKKYKISVLLLIDNNGKRPDQNNYKLKWYEDYVRISVIHYNGTCNSVRLYFDDLLPCEDISGF